MELVISELAKEDLASIEEYTRDNWGKLQADIYLSQIEHRILSLLETPYLHCPSRRFGRLQMST